MTDLRKAIRWFIFEGDCYQETPPQVAASSFGACWCGEFAVPISSRQSLVGTANSKATLETIDFASAGLIPNFAQRMPRSDAKFGIGALERSAAPRADA